MQIIRDSLPMDIQMIPSKAEEVCRKHGIPVFKGKLYRHEGPIDQNVDDWGNPIFTHVNDNTVVLGGAVMALRYLFGRFESMGQSQSAVADDTSGFIPATLNSIYSTNSADAYNAVNVVGDLPAVRLFGVGTGGASAERFGDVFDPDFKQRELIDWIPFKVSDTTSLPDNTIDANKYYFRRQFSSAPSVQYGWYLKEFENRGNVPIISRWKDTVDSVVSGSVITDEIYDDTSSNLIESYGECILKITEDDIKPYFEFTGDLTMARYNTIGLFSGVKRQIDAASNYWDYCNVRLFSVVNMDNVSVKIPTECTYLYRVYAAV